MNNSTLAEAQEKYRHQEKRKRYAQVQYRIAVEDIAQADLFFFCVQYIMCYNQSLAMLSVISTSSWKEFGFVRKQLAPRL